MAKASQGWIQKRGQRYRARIIVDGFEYSESFDTRALAGNWLGEMRERHRIGRLRRGLDPTKISLGAALQRYAIEISPTKLNVRKETGAIRRLLREEPRLCAIPLGHVLIADLNDFSTRRMNTPASRTGKPVSAATVRGDFAIISNLYTIAKTRWGYESVINPIGRGTRPVGGTERARRVTAEEFERLFVAGAEYESDIESRVPIRGIIAWAVWTAMRRSEIAGVKWSDINLQTGVVTLGKTKNGTARTVPLRQEAYDLLLAMGPLSSGLVFQTTSAAIGTAWQRVRKRAGIEDLHFHDLRHEATSRYFEDARKYGLTDTEIGTITGHRTWAMLRRYTHLRAVDIAAKLRPRSGATSGNFTIEAPAPVAVIERRARNGQFREAAEKGGAG